MLTRKSEKEVVHIDLAFSPIDALPKSQLPTKSDVIKSLLNEKKLAFLGEGFSGCSGTHRYMHCTAYARCTVYPLSKKQVTEKIARLILQLSKLKKYSKRIRGKTK